MLQKRMPRPSKPNTFPASRATAPRGRKAPHPASPRFRMTSLIAKSLISFLCSSRPKTMFENTLSTLWGDIRYAVRIMLRAPLFTATVVLTVALAISANATIFTVVNAVMIKSLPFAEPNRILQVAEKNDKLNLPTFAASILNFVSWREQTQSFEQLAGVGYATFTLSGSGEPEQLSGNPISPALTHVLGTRMLAGREFRADEEKPGGAAVAIIGEGLWKRRFASDPALLGRTI